VRSLKYILASSAVCVLRGLMGAGTCSCSRAGDSPRVKNGAVVDGGSAANIEATASVQPVIIDTRSPQEYAGGHLAGALLMPHDAIGSMIDARVPDKNTPIRLYCLSGGRSEMARKTLVSLNYTRVENLGGMRSAAGTLKKEVVK
jgi:phage shock protein E